MRFSFLWKIFFGIAFCLLIAVPTGRVQAFEVRPAIIDIAIPTGSSTEREIHIHNNESVKKELFFTVQKFEAGGSGSPRFLDPKDVVGLPTWLRVSSPQITLDPGAVGDVRVRIDVPSSTEPGGYYVGVFTTERATNGTSGALGKRIATLLLVNVAGEQAPAHMEVKEIVQKHALNKGSVEVAVKNTGKTHGFATIKTTIRRWTLWGMRKNEDTRVVRLLPGESRKTPFHWQDARSLTFFIQTDVRIEEAGAATSLSEIEYQSIGCFALGGLSFGGVILFLMRRKRPS